MNNEDNNDFAPKRTLPELNSLQVIIIDIINII